MSGPQVTGALNEDLKALLATYRELANTNELIESLDPRLGDYRVRMDELHAQIVTLQAVKSGGSLMKHLKQKMLEIIDLCIGEVAFP